MAKGGGQYGMKTPSGPEQMDRLHELLRRRGGKYDRGVL